MDIPAEERLEIVDGGTPMKWTVCPPEESGARSLERERPRFRLLSRLKLPRFEFKPVPSPAPAPAPEPFVG